MRLSLREQLRKIGEPRKLPLAIPSDFYLARKSLRELMRAMESPRVDEWVRTVGGQFDNQDWTDECQGLISDGEWIYAASNDAGHRAIYRMGADFGVQATLDLPAMAEELAWGTSPAFAPHIGGPGFGDGTLFVPINIGYDENTQFEALSNGWPLPPLEGPRVWEIDAAGFVTSEVRAIQLPEEVDYFFFGWCAKNPWDGHLYASADGSDADGVTEIYAFHHHAIGPGFPAFWAPIERGGKHQTLVIDGPIFGVQGGFVSPGGKLYLSAQTNIGRKKGIFVFSIINGHCFGIRTFDTDNEPEAVALFRVSQLATDIQLVVLSNEIEDDVHLESFRVPDPKAL